MLSLKRMQDAALAGLGPDLVPTLGGGDPGSGSALGSGWV